MDVEVHRNLHDERKSDCRSSCSNIHPSSQSRKISIGVMADYVANTRDGAMKVDGAIMPNTERVISNGGNCIGERSKVEEVTISFNMKQIGVPEEVKCARITKSFCEKTPASATNLLANQASTRRLDKPDGLECAAAKYSFQLLSNQTSKFHSSNHNQKKFDAITSKRKRKKDGTPERVDEVTFTTAQEVFESDKTKPEDKRNKTENRTENLRSKLWQILGTPSSPKTHRSGSQTRNMDDENLPPEQRLDKKDETLIKIGQNSNTIELDSENPDHTNRRPVTRSWSRKRASAKMHPSKSKSGSSSKDKEKHQEKSIFTLKEGRTGRRSASLDDDSSMSSRKKGQRKDYKIGSRKIYFLENDTAHKLCQKISKTDIPPHDEEIFSLGNKMGGFHCCLFDHQKECPQSEEMIQEKEIFQSPTINKTDLQGEFEGSENGNQQEDRSNPVVEIRKNVADPQDNFRSPTFGLKTPTLSSSPSSMPKTDQKVSDVSSPASTERRFSLGTFRNLRTSQTLEPGCNRLRAQRQSSDIGELRESVPRKVASFVKEKEAQDCLSDSSSEERNFQGSQEGSRERQIAEKQTLMFHPIKRPYRNEGIKINDNCPASPSSKGTAEIDLIHEDSEQNQEDGFVRAVELFALELGKVKSKLKSVTSQKSSEILMSAAEDIHLQLQNVHSQIQTDAGKLTSLRKSKRKRLETRFEDRQKQLRLIQEKFKEEVNMHVRDCRIAIEGLEADQIEIKGVLEKQRASHRKLLSQVEAAAEIQLNDAQRKIRAIQELGKGKLLQLKHVIAMCLKEGILN